jgi:hypothetical protein
MAELNRLEFLYLDARMWRNWYTRTLEVRVA